MERNGIKMKLSRVGGIHVLFLKNEMINYLEYGKEVFFFSAAAAASTTR